MCTRGEGKASADRKSRNRGASLVEMVVALLVFGVVVTGMCRLLVTVKETCDRARDHYVAVNIGKNRVERARAFEFDQLYLFAESNIVVNANGASDPTANFRRTTFLQTVRTNLVEMVVRVDIRDRVTLGFDRNHEIMRTYIADTSLKWSMR